MTINHKEAYEAGRYRTCYKPYPPFYNLCITGMSVLNDYNDNDASQMDYIDCIDCMKKNHFSLNLEIAAIDWIL